jgi:hypothetical protein
MRLLRRLEKNHDGIRSATTRQHYIQIYQAIKYLSLDVADFLARLSGNLPLSGLKGITRSLKAQDLDIRPLPEKCIH